MLERYCDALIIGTEIPGLITAAFLARRGLTVHVLDMNPYSKSDREPDPFCVAHLHSKLLRSILGRLNIPEPDIQNLSGSDSPLQVIFPRQRIDISSNPITFYEELEREFPDQHDALKNFYENLAHLKHKVETQSLYSHLLPNSFMERRKLAKYVKEHDLDATLDNLGLPLAENQALKNFLLAQLNLVTYTHVSTPFSYQVAELLNPSEGEILSIKGGHHYLKRLFLDRIEHHEGAYRAEAKIEKLLFKNGIFEGVKLAGSDENILARYVIWNTHLKRLADYLPNMFRFRKLRKVIRDMKPAAHWFTAQFEVPTALIPAPMHENILVIEDPQGELKGTNYLYLQVKKEKESTSKLSVSYLLEPEALTWPNETFQELHQQILKTLNFLIPFSENELHITFPVNAAKEHEDTLFPLHEDDFEIFRQAAEMHPVYRLNTKSFTELFPLSFRTAAPNFFLTSPEILGTMGYEGKYMLGLKVTDIIWQDVEKEKKRAMKQERRIA